MYTYVRTTDRVYVHLHEDELNIVMITVAYICI